MKTSHALSGILKMKDYALKNINGLKCFKNRLYK